MAVYLIRPIVFDEDENPLNNLDLDGEIDDLWPLSVPLRLKAIWRRLELKGNFDEKIEAYTLNLRAPVVTKRVADAWAGIVGDAAEFLPVAVQGVELYVVHCLWRVSLGPNAKASVNSVSKNVTWINKYDFDAKELERASLFEISQPAGSAAGNVGMSMGSLLAVDPVASQLRRTVPRGMDFTKVFDGSSAAR
ncbi:MAG: hypothetical protein R3B84_16635 [Zavarzinella sp.]